jgi:hypothetical protein
MICKDLDLISNVLFFEDLSSGERILDFVMSSENLDKRNVYYIVLS